MRQDNAEDESGRRESKMFDAIRYADISNHSLLP